MGSITISLLKIEWCTPRPRKLTQAGSEARWKILVSKTAFLKFLVSLPHLFQEGSVLEMEGTSIEPDVPGYFGRFTVVNTMKKTEFSLFRWPPIYSSEVACAFQLPLEQMVMQKIADFYQNHAQPEVLDHIYVFDRNGQLLLNGFELCGGTGHTYVSEQIDGDSIQTFCHETGCRYEELGRVNARKQGTQNSERVIL